MIGFGRPPSGGFGNRLFHYNFLAQLAKKTKSDIFFKKKVSEQVLDVGIECSSLPFFSRKSRVDSVVVKGMSDAELYFFVLDEQRIGRHVVFDGPFLGDYFYRVNDVNPNEFFSFSGGRSSKGVCAIHFRGGDFKSWDESAILSVDYYIASIEHIVKCAKDPSLLCFDLITDDASLENYRAVKKYLQDSGLSLIKKNRAGTVVGDFRALCHSEYIISSPSTFAVWGGILGVEEKKIVHSKKWIDYRADLGDAFWARLKLGGDSRYSLWASIDE